MLYPAQPTALKLYCGYKYTTHFMINRVRVLKQLWLQVNSHAWFYLLGLRRSVRKGSKRNNSWWKYMSPPGIKPATLWFLAEHLNRLAIEEDHEMCFQLVQYSEMKGNSWGIFKDVAIQYIKLFMVLYVLQQNFRQNLPWRCHLLLLTFKI